MLQLLQAGAPAGLPALFGLGVAQLHDVALPPQLRRQVHRAALPLAAQEGRSDAADSLQQLHSTREMSSERRIRKSLALLHGLESDVLQLQLSALLPQLGPQMLHKRLLPMKGAAIRYTASVNAPKASRCQEALEVRDALCDCTT